MLHRKAADKAVKEDADLIELEGQYAAEHRQKDGQNPHERGRKRSASVQKTAQPAAQTRAQSAEYQCAGDAYPRI